jgi:hypothetical protein
LTEIGSKFSETEASRFRFLSSESRCSPALVVVVGTKNIVSIGLTYGLTPMVERHGYQWAFGVLAGVLGAVALLGLPVYYLKFQAFLTHTVVNTTLLTWKHILANIKPRKHQILPQMATTTLLDAGPTRATTLSLPSQRRLKMDGRSPPLAEEISHH